MAGKISLRTSIKSVRRWLLYGDRANALTYARRLNRKGARIDESIQMAVPESVRLDESAAYMLEIGKNVFLAEGVKIMTHDASWLIMKAEDGIIRGHTAPVKIGNNVFIGIDSIILCNTSICDYVIIGAGSVVSTSIKKPGVYAGNPARLVIPIDKLKEIRESRQVKEAYAIARQYYERFHQKPPKELFNEYFWIFEDRRNKKLEKVFQEQMEHCGNLLLSQEKYLSSKPDFDNYDDFWNWCKRRMEQERK